MDSLQNPFVVGPFVVSAALILHLWLKRRGSLSKWRSASRITSSSLL